MRQRRFVFALAAIIFSGFGLAQEMSFEVRVRDAETGLPLTNATVRAGFQHRTYSWNESMSSTPVFAKTDERGVAQINGKSNCGEVWCTVKGLDDYYKPQPIRFFGDKGECKGVARNMIRLFVPEKWIVTNDVRIMMRKVGNPIPLCAKRIERWEESGLYPAGTNTIAYDLMQGDWLPPLGKGVHADVELVHRRIDKGEGCLYQGSKVKKIWRDEVDLRFTGKDNGLVGYTSDPSETLRIRTAPEDGYSPTHLIWAEKDKNLRYHTSEDPNRSYAFRIRTRRNERGEIVEAFYGKIYRNPRLLDGGGYPLHGFDMIYYLNPTPLDRNLEWDRKNNGFKGECPPYRLP